MKKRILRIKADSVTYMYMHDVQLLFRSLTSYILLISLINCLKDDECREMMKYRAGLDED